MIWRRISKFLFWKVLAADIIEQQHIDCWALMGGVCVLQQLYLMFFTEYETKVRLVPLTGFTLSLSPVRLR